MSPEYQSRVLEDYQIKKTQSRLSYNLMALTPAKIKQECLVVFYKRPEKRDEKLLKLFFNEREEYTELGQAVKKCEADRFRPLIKFLKGQSKTTDEKHIELLAWLIDFEGRPFRPDYEKMYEARNVNDIIRPGVLHEEEVQYKVERTAPSPSSQPELVSLAEINVNENSEVLRFVPIADDDQEKTVEKSGNTERTTTFKKKYYVPLGIIAFLVIPVFFWIINKKKDEELRLLPVINGTRQCMYWAEDHYEQVYCNQRPKDVEVYAFDHQKAAQLKKITHPDTITLKAIGRVWYVKLDGRIEYFTAAGFHPVHTDLKLKPLTAYMYNKYLFHYSENGRP